MAVNHWPSGTSKSWFHPSLVVNLDPERKRLKVCFKIVDVLFYWSLNFGREWRGEERNLLFKFGFWERSERRGEGSRSTIATGYLSYLQKSTYLNLFWGMERKSEEILLFTPYFFIYELTDYMHGQLIFQILPSKFYCHSFAYIVLIRRLCKLPWYFHKRLCILARISIFK